MMSPWDSFLFDANSGKLLKRLEVRTPSIRKMAVSPDSRFLACVYEEPRKDGKSVRFLKTLELSTGRKGQEFMLGDDEWQGWSLAGQLLTVARRADGIVICEPATGRKRRIQGASLGIDGSLLNPPYQASGSR